MLLSRFLQEVALKIIQECQERFNKLADEKKKLLRI